MISKLVKKNHYKDVKDSFPVHFPISCSVFMRESALESFYKLKFKRQLCDSHVKLSRVVYMRTQNSNEESRNSLCFWKVETSPPSVLMTYFLQGMFKKQFLELENLGCGFFFPGNLLCGQIVC